MSDKEKVSFDDMFFDGPEPEPAPEGYTLAFFNIKEINPTTPLGVDMTRTERTLEVGLIPESAQVADLSDKENLVFRLPAGSRILRFQVGCRWPFDAANREATSQPPARPRQAPQQLLK
jgi:hypothetical protein